MDWGLLQGIGSGLQQGAQTYFDEKGKAQKLALEKRNQKAKEVEAGAQKGLKPEYDEQGNLIQYTPIEGLIDPAKQEKQSLELKTGGDLRSEFTKRPEIKAHADVLNAYEKVIKNASTGTPASDMSLIFGYMKLLDPASTVREGEQAQAQDATGVPDRIRNAYNAALKGTKLSPEQREDFALRAQDIAKISLAGRRRVESEYGELAKEYGVRPKLVYTPAGDLTPYQKRQIQQQQAAQEQGLLSKAKGFLGSALAGAPKEALPSQQGPKPGDKVDGWTFKGGDPANKKNWSK